MHLGVDFDNTIVCYDAVFHEIAVERGWIDPATPASKLAVRNTLRAAGREDDWTHLQGEVYGDMILRATPFPGVLETLGQLRRSGVKISIISHKTKYPYAGPQVNLHDAARSFLDHHGVFSSDGVGLPREDAHFEVTIEEKLARVGAAGCDAFVDDLPEVLAEPVFPTGVAKILFDPNHRHDAPSFLQLNQWSDMPQLLASLSAEWPAGAKELASSCTEADDYTLHLIAGGRNNRVYRLSAGGESYLLKSYFRGGVGQRDRLASEFRFCQFAHRATPARTPQPLAQSPQHGLAIYSYLSGRRPTKADVNEEIVLQAADLPRAWAEHKSDPLAAKLMQAAESCQSLDDHANSVDRRLKRFRDQLDETPHGNECRDFIEAELAPRFESIRDALPAKVAPFQPCISPSDFGFHNVLLGDGQLKFVDFEYAGWDDPAKMTADFFAQPDYDIPFDLLPAFVDRLGSIINDDGRLLDRVRTVLPLHILKWSLIVLNDFLPVDRDRRQFAQGSLNLSSQLAKSRRLLERFV